MSIVAVIEPNIWVSAFLNPQGYPARLVAAGKAGGLVVVSSPPLLEELMEVLLRPRIMKIRQTNAADAEVYVRGVAALARMVSVTGTLRVISINRGETEFFGIGLWNSSVEKNSVSVVPRNIEKTPRYTCVVILTTMLCWKQPWLAGQTTW